MDPMQHHLSLVTPQSPNRDSLFRQVFELTSDAFFLLKRLPEGSWSYEEVNRSAEAFLHATAEQLVGRPLQEVLPPELAAYFSNRCAQCIEQGGPFTYFEEVDLPVGRSYFSTSLIPLRDLREEITHIAGVCRDVTEQRREEETRRESQKLESLGVMAGGIAHDFNNLLTIALGNLSILQSHLSPDRPEHHFLVSLEEALLKSADLTRQILAYAGRGRMAVSTLELSLTLRSMTSLIAASVPKKIRVDYDLQEGLHLIDADSSQLQQVVMNLVMNAAEAIGTEVGTITVRTTENTYDQDQLRALLPGQPVRPGPVVILEVTDTGPGIDPQILPRIFDPFFTTKGAGRGLGLSAIQGILRGHGAGIEFHGSLLIIGSSASRRRFPGPGPARGRSVFWRSGRPGRSGRATAGRGPSRVRRSPRQAGPGR